MTLRCRPEWDITAAGTQQAWEAGDRLFSTTESRVAEADW